jgi:hypothetical protein
MTQTLFALSKEEIKEIGTQKAKYRQKTQAILEEMKKNNFRPAPHEPIFLATEDMQKARIEIAKHREYANARAAEYRRVNSRTNHQSFGPVAGYTTK